MKEGRIVIVSERRSLSPHDVISIMRKFNPTNRPDVSMPLIQRRDMKRYSFYRNDTILYNKCKPVNCIPNRQFILPEEGDIREVGR